MCRVSGENAAHGAEHFDRAKENPHVANGADDVQRSATR